MNEPRPSARFAHAAIALFAVLAAAKLAGLAGRELAVGPLGAIPVYLWQDAALALAFGTLAASLRGRVVVRAVFALIALYAALNAAVVVELSSPMTVAMWRAADAALSDSILSRLTPRNLAVVLLVLAVAWAAPWGLRRARRSVPAWPVALALAALVAIGAPAASRIATRGLERSAVVALIESAWPRGGSLAAARRGGEWRRGPFDTEPVAAPDLSGLRGAARGCSVVLVVLESAAARYLAPHGAAENPMPFVSELARRSLVFDAAYAVYPESIKGMVALLASLHPAPDTDPEDYRALPHPSLAATLRSHGHEAALFHSGRFEYLGMDAVLEGQSFDRLVDAADISGVRESSFGVDERDTVDRALRWLDARADASRPFLLAYLPIAGHHPYDAPEPGPFPADTVIGAYRNALHYADRCIAELHRGIGARGLAERTVFVVVGDHGQAFGQHGGNFGHTFEIYDENVHVPLVISAPGAAAVRVGYPVSHVDVAPTLLDMLGLDAPAGWHGRSILAGPPGVALFFTDYSLLLAGLRDGRFKFLCEPDGPRAELYDVAVDPDECVDLAGRHPERVAAYRAHVRGWISGGATR